MQPRRELVSHRSKIIYINFPAPLNSVFEGFEVFGYSLADNEYHESAFNYRNPTKTDRVGFHFANANGYIRKLHQLHTNLKNTWDRWKETKLM